ncbi:MAG: TRAP transporter small permease [Bdellovibrionales bacterium]
MAGRAKYLLKNFEELICGFFILIMVVTVIANVLLRYIFDYSIYWAEEVSTICFVWATFVGASAVYKHKMDIGIDVLLLRLPKFYQNIARFIVSILLLLINGYIFYMSIVFTHMSFQKPTAVLGISSAVFNSALIFGFGLITLHTLKFLKQDFVILVDREV